jgi:diguanylate cyclase (GGDEF)-like protein/PAS domain S-box-containing protein
MKIMRTPEARLSLLKNMMTTLVSMPIRAQILLLAFIVAFPAAGIIVYSGIQTRKEAIHDARLETQRLAGNIAAEQQNLITAAQQLMIALAQLPQVKEHNRDRVEPILRAILKLNAQYSNIFIANRNGLVWATAVPVKSPFIIADRNYFKNALASGQLSSGEFVISRATTRPTFNIAYPLKNDRGAIVDVISVGFKIDALKELLERAMLPSDAHMTLLDNQGAVIYRSIDTAKFIGKQFDAALFKEMQAGPDMATFDSTLAMQGDKRVLTYRKLYLPSEKSPYMYIRAGIPVATVLAGANKVLIQNLSVFTSFLFLAILFAWFIGKRSIADRVTVLEKASRNLAKGDLNVRVSDLVVGGELGRLGQTFDAMAHQLSLREQALTKSEQRLKLAAASGHLGIWDRDIETGKQIWDDRMYEIYGVTKNSFPATFEAWGKRLHQDDRERVMKESQAAIRGEKDYDTEFRILHPDGSVKNIKASGLVIRDTKGKATRIIGINWDITEQKNLEEKLRNLSLTDGLTGLYNRRGFFTMVEPLLMLAKRYRRSVFLLYADMDGLKEINDVLGHHEGDQAIIDMANIFKATFRETDIIARIGGDEFVVIPIADKREDADIVTARFKERVTAHNKTKGRAYKLTISAGMSCYDPSDPRSIDDLLRQAERLMYEEKMLKQKTG